MTTLEERVAAIEAHCAQVRAELGLDIIGEIWCEPCESMIGYTAADVVAGFVECQLCGYHVSLAEV